MSDMLEHQGYCGSVSYSGDDRIFHGKVAFIRDLVTFEGSDVRSLRKAFVEAVDDYLAACKVRGKKPDHPFKGTFNVRTGSVLHRKAALMAERRGMSLNTVVTEALEKYLG